MAGRRPHFDSKNRRLGDSETGAFGITGLISTYRELRAGLAGSFRFVSAVTNLSVRGYMV